MKQAGIALLFLAFVVASYYAWMRDEWTEGQKHALRPSPSRWRLVHFFLR